MHAPTCFFPACQKTEELKKCSICKVAAYCSKEHQTSDWGKHKVLCNLYADMIEQEALTALHVALCQSDDVQAVEEYIRKKWNINAFDTDGWTGYTPLMVAAIKNRVKCMKVLLEAKAGLEGKDRESECTALLFAVLENNPECVKLLLEANADCNAKTKHVTTLEYQLGASDALSDYTALHVAASENYTECVKLLLKANADYNITKWRAVTPLFVATMECNIASMKLLLNANADCNAGLLRPLHTAVENGQDACVKLLLDAKADYDAIGIQAVTPLYAAAFEGQHECLKMLIDAKADLEKQLDSVGMTPLMAACQEGHIDCVSELVEAKANIKAVDEKGRTSLDLARQYNEDDIVAVLIGQSAMVHVKKTKRKKKKKKP